MDQFLRSAIDLSDIESKVLSGGYESDSGYSTYDVSPITSSAPTQLTYPTSAQMAAVQPHGHHMEPAFFNYTLSPTATVFPGHAPAAMNQPSTSLLHDMQSPCSSDVGFFSPHSGFSSHATTPSHQDALTFFPAHGTCSMFGSYSQPQDFDPLNISTCFPNASVPNSDSTIPTFSSQIPDILLPDASLTTEPPVSMPSTSVATATESIKLPKLEAVQTACKLQVPQTRKLVESAPVQVAKPAVQVKVESRSTSCAVANQSKDVPEGQVKTERGEETKSTTKETSSKSSQAILSKLLTPSGTQPKIVSITAINNNGTKTKLDLSQLQTLVGQSASGKEEKTAKPSSQSGSVSDSEVHSVSTQASPSKTRSLTSSPKAVPMKATQKKKAQWPRSMSKANLMAFREHILNKLKKGQGSSSVAGSSNNSQKETISEAGKVEVMKCETPSPSTSGEVNVTYERNRSSDSRCHSEPADVFGGPNCSPCLQQLQSSHSEGCLASSMSSQQQQVFVPSDADTKLAEFFPQNCNDVLNLFQFNPDALLSTTIDDQILDGLDLGFDSDDSCKVDNEIARFLDSEMSSSSSETPMEVGVHYDVMRDNSPITTPPLSHHASPLVSPATYDSHPSSPQTSVTPSCNYVPLANTRPYLPERALVTGHVTSGPMSNMQMGMFNFPDILIGENGVGGVSCESDMKLHIQQNLLQAHHDPLLTGSSTLLQACGSETFEF